MANYTPNVPPKIKCILFSEFHPITGPKITYQVPLNYISKEEFDMLHVYIITKPELQSKVITINALGHKILGCPVCIENRKYKRNALIFNLCFVFDDTADTTCYDGVVKKLAEYMTTLELESGFLSQKGSRSLLPDLLTNGLRDINQSGTCSIPINQSTTIRLKVIPSRTDPEPVQGHDVPIFIIDKSSLPVSQWDLTTQQLLPYIDGFLHVSRIAMEADIDINIVKLCIQNMLQQRVVTLISIFQYSNVYTVTPSINILAESADIQNEALKFVVKQGSALPEFQDVFVLYCGLNPGITVRDLCARHNPHMLRVDERKLIQFGLMKGFIRRMHKYPSKLPHVSGSQRLRHLYKWFDGRHCYDEICCAEGLSYQELDEKTENDPSVIMLWK